LIYILVDVYCPTLLPVALSISAHVNTLCGRYKSALAAASNHDHIAMVQMLLDHGADINLPHWRNSSPLELAVKIGHGCVSRLLLDSGALVDTTDSCYIADAVLDAAKTGE
jgi:ankyrin repeat protein